MRLFVAAAHYDPEGHIAPHVRRNIEALAAVADRLIFVTTADLTDDDARWVSQRAELIRRENYGYDFYSYRSGLLEVTDLADYSHVVVCNDSFVGPLVPYEQIFETMAERPLDFWGLTRSARVQPHVQSFFICFNSWVVRSQAFEQFWHRMTPLSDRRQVIHRYEVGLSRELRDAGFTFGSYYSENQSDERMARMRMVWRARLIARRESKRSRGRDFLRRAREPWNPSTALADRALGAATLPFVKIDTLRYDPYGLESDRLLRSCMQARPDLFADLPDYLERTAPYYPVRPEEVMPSLGAAGRLLAPVVRYS